MFANIYRGMSSPIKSHVLTVSSGDAVTNKPGHCPLIAKPVTSFSCASKLQSFPAIQQS